jgi:hypothetical protein
MTVLEMAPIVPPMRKSRKKFFPLLLDIMLRSRNGG